MERHNPYELISVATKGSLEKFPCSILALGLAISKAKLKVDEVGIKVDKNGYCQLRNIDDAIRIHFKVEQYRYYREFTRRKLSDFIEFPGQYIVCVKGHYIYVDGSNYYSFFDNDEDMVVAYWKLGEKDGTKQDLSR